MGQYGRPKKVADAGHVATAKRMKADGHTARDIAKYPQGEPGDVVSEF